MNPLANGTPPEAIVRYLTSLGLTCEAHTGMTLDDLYAAFAAGSPVIVALQDWCEPGELDAEACGHYVIVCAVWSNFVFVQDPSETSVMIDQGGAGADGKVAIPAAEFLRRWRDVDAHGNELVRWGCAVRKGVVESDDAVGRKIAKLKGEGKSQEQSVAIALNMQKRGSCERTNRASTGEARRHAGRD